MKKFYTPGRTNQVRQEIQVFKQGDYESFCDAWERFRSLARKCPHHGFSTWHLMNIFYNRLNESSRNRVDYSCGGSIMEKYDDKIEEIMEKIAETDSHRLSLNNNGRNVESKRGGVIDVHGKEAEIKIERNEHMIGKIETNIEKLTNLMEKFVTHTNVSKVQEVPCSLCLSRDHHDGLCAAREEVNAMNYVHPYKPWNARGNENYKDHQPPYPHKPYSPSYNQTPRQTNESNVSDFQVMKAMMEQLTKSVHGMSKQLNLVTNRMDWMEEHVRPPMTVMENTRGKEKEMGSNKDEFPTQPSVNPRNISSVESQEFSPPEDSLDSLPRALCDSVHAITRLRSGKILEDPIECDLEDKKKEIVEENEKKRTFREGHEPHCLSATYTLPRSFEIFKTSQ